jgi:MFS family permease
MGACNQLSVTIGIFLVNLVGGVLVVESHGQAFCQWRYLAFLGAFLAVVLTGATVAPESPQWLAKGNFREGTVSALRRLRASPAEPEADQIFSDMAESQSGGSSSGGLGQYKKSLVVAIGLCAYQQFSGVNAVMMYTTSICESAGMANPAAMSTVIMGAQVVLTLISCVLMEKLGRRLLLLFGSASMALGHLVLALYFFKPDVVPSMLALVALFVFILGFSWGLGPIPWIMMAEVFPTSVAAKCAALATAVNWGSSFVVTLSFSYLEEGLTKEGTFLLLGIICVSCFFFTLLLVPETRGLSVDEVLVKLNGKTVRNVETVNTA